MRRDRGGHRGMRGRNMNRGNSRDVGQSGQSRHSMDLRHRAELGDRLPVPPCDGWSSDVVFATVFVPTLPGFPSLPLPTDSYLPLSPARPRRLAD